MDERLLKSAVESIEMPSDMKDRIIENCRSGEAKPLFMPKKRFVYMPMAVTSCVCVLVAALAGVGVWQLKVLSDNSSQPPTLGSDDIGIEPVDYLINVIPLTDYDIETAGYWKEKPDPDDHIGMTEEELSEYYGIDVTHLLYGLGIKPSVYEADSDGPGLGIYRADSGTGEILFDINCFVYGEKGEITINISKLAIPFSIPKLWSDSDQLSTINGVTAAVGITPEDMRSIIEFKLEQYGLYFNVWCEQDMVVDVVSDIIEQCDLQLSKDDPPVQTGDPLTLERLVEICRDDPSNLSWSDFQGYDCMDIGSGLYILQYPIGDKYTLTIGGAPESKPYYMEFHAAGQYYSIDIREDSLEEYLNEPIPEGDVINVIPITWDDINNGELSAETDFVEGDQVYMTDEQLSDYYGIDITAFDNIPSDMVLYSYQGTPGGESRHIWRSNGGAGDIYYDQNAFYYAAPDGSRSIMITVGTLPNYIEKLWKDQKMLSRINGKTVAIGQTENGYYEAEFTSADSRLGFEVSGSGITLEELCDVIAALVEQSQ